MTLSNRDVERFGAWIGATFGFRFDDTNRSRLEDLLAARVGPSRGVEEYLAHLAAPEGVGEVAELAKSITVTETYFFRNPDHFRVFEGTVLPERRRQGGSRRPLRVLSLGCASGEEPYSLAMVARETLERDDAVEIIAVDVNRLGLAKARAGRYSSWSLRGTPTRVRERYFTNDKGEWVLAPEVRSMVKFEEQNLTRPGSWAATTWDAVFCRNVLMYMNESAIREALARIAAALAPGGYLFLGHAETTRGLSDRFELCHTHGTFYYRRPEGMPADTSPPDDESTSGPEAGWFDVIGSSSNRIASLAARHAVGPGRPFAAEAHEASIEAAYADVLSALERERYDEALELLDERGFEIATQGQPMVVRAAILLQAGRFAEAEDSAHLVLAIDARSAGAHYVLALCREQAGDLQGARAHDRLAADIDGRFAMPHLHLGLLAKRAGVRSEATSALRRALALLPHEEASRIVLFGGGFSRFALADVCRRELDRVEAEES